MSALVPGARDDSSPDGIVRGGYAASSPEALLLRRLSTAVARAARPSINRPTHAQCRRAFPYPILVTSIIGYGYRAHLWVHTRQSLELSIDFLWSGRNRELVAFPLLSDRPRVPAVIRP